MGESVIYPSLPKAWTPLSSTHWKNLLYFPILTSSWCKISLWWIFCGGKKREGGTPEQTELSLAQRLSWAPFPDPDRVPGKKKWYKTRANSLLEQVPADFWVHWAERIIQEVDVCVLIHGSRKCRETSGEDTSYSLGLISESWRDLTTPCSFQEPRERGKTLLHTGPPSERALHAHIH